ncbi:MAG: PilW family protein [Rhodoferax sp.]|nr:PilW family protein [Rhodoferax sp.]
MKSLRSLRRARGISLIEILISLAIGMVVVVAVIVSYLGSGQASRYHTALTQMNQDAQTGLNMLAREIQLAGYSAPAALSGANPSVISYYNLACPTGGCPLPLLAATTGGTAGYIFGCDATKGTAPFTDATADVLACQPAGATRSSGFGVVYEADVKNTVAVTVAATGLLTPTNCKGEALTVTTPAIGLPYYIARNRYYVDTQTGANTTGRPELYCASAGSNGVPFIENVDDMQVWYGLATATVTSAPASRQVTRYVQAGKDATTPGTVNAINAATPGEWEKVVAVRICLLMRSAEPVLTAEDSATYQPCDSNAAVATSADGYLRRAYYTTATLRSKMAY